MERTLMECSPWGHKQSDMTEQLSTALAFHYTDIPQFVLIELIPVFH